jgi:Raf kinase inhibitor-like YbhB/YbcL family protein
MRRHWAQRATRQICSSGGRLLALVAGVNLSCACGQGEAERESSQPPTPSVTSTAAAPSVTAEPVATQFALTSPAFEDVAGCSTTDPAPCDVFPNENIGYDGNPDLSPELRWAGAPTGTQSFAITLHDLTSGQPQWVIWNIPAALTELPAGLEEGTATLTTPAGAQQSSATFAPEVGYFGPQAPCNVYQFEIFALSVPEFTPADAKFAALVRTELLALSADVVLARATLNVRTKYDATCE